MNTHHYKSSLLTSTFTTAPEVGEIPTANSRLGKVFAMAIGISILLASLMLGAALFLLVLAITPIAALGLWWITRKASEIDDADTTD